MKKWMLILLVMTALISPGIALAQQTGGVSMDALPQQVREAIRQDGIAAEEVADILMLPDVEGSDWCLIAQGSGWMEGYRKLPSGEWACQWSGPFWFGAKDLDLEREGDTSFRVESNSLDAWMRYESRGVGFDLVSWQDGSAYRGHASIGENAVTFIPDDGGAEIVIPIGEELKTWLNDFESLAKTPEELRARAAIGQEAASVLMPGWKLGYYEMFNSGTAADAGYYRIEDGQLTVFRLGLDSEQGITWKSESLAVPLSAPLLQLLETEDANSLLDMSGYGSTFLTPDAWDTEKIPIQGKILANDLQAHVLLALTERDGQRYIVLAEPDEQGAWSVRESKPLPKQAGIDLFHCGDDELSLEWMEGEQDIQCGFSRQADGHWRMTWAWAREGEYSLTWYGLMLEFNGLFNNMYAYGTASFADLMACDWNALPASAKEAAERMDPSGWAAVKNPNPLDRLHLRNAPSKSGDSLGKFYNGTPLEVLENRGDWCRVRIGCDRTLEGWMMKEYLIFGKDLRSVTQTFPELLVREEAVGSICWADVKRQSRGFVLRGGEQVIGVAEQEKLYVIMTTDGRVGYADMDCFWEGNG